MMRRPKFGRSRIISICKQPKKSSLNLVSPIAGTIGHWRHASLRQSAMTVSGKPTVIYPITGTAFCCRHQRLRCRAADTSDEGVPFHSMTSSARASTEDGI